MRNRPCRFAVVFVFGLAAGGAAQARPDPTPAGAASDDVPAGAGELTKLEGEIQRLQRAGRLAEALSLAVTGVPRSEQKLGAAHPVTIALLTSRAMLLQSLGRPVEAETDYRSALGRAEKTFGPNDLSVTTILLGLGGARKAKGDYAAAEAHYRRALGIAERGGPRGTLAAAVALNNLATLFQEQGDGKRAREHLERALPMLEAGLGPRHPAVASFLGNLGVFLMLGGDYVPAQAALERALATLEQALGPAHPDVAVALDNLAQLHQRKGDSKRAESLFDRALRIREKSFGPTHVAVATTLNNLSLVHYSRGDLPRAEQLAGRALAIVERALGPLHPHVAACLNNVAEVLRARNQHARAEPYSRRALAIVEGAFGAQHPDVATALNNLAGAVLAKGDVAEARRLLARAVAIAEAGEGPRHPHTAMYLSNLARLHLLGGDPAQAITLQARAEEAFEHNASLILAQGTEEQRQAFMGTLASLTNVTVSLHAQAAPQSAAAARLALVTVLRRKARVVDAVAESLGTLRRRLTPADRATLDRLGVARGRLAQQVLRGGADADEGAPAGPRARRAALEGEIERLEAKLASRSAEFRVGARPVTLEAVQAEIPAGAALVELYRYLPFDARAAREPGRAWGKPRYVAYVARRTGAPAWRDLGDAVAIEGAAERLRRALAAPERTDARALGRRLDELVMRPLRPLLEGATLVLLAPDGALTVVPFGALVDEQGRYLVETHAFGYLTSGRDLLRLKLAARPRQKAVVVAAPDFDEAGSSAAAAPAAAPGAAATRSGDLARARFAPLPGTGDEARELAHLLRGATVRIGAAATEGELKRLAGPEVLHLATHGFFLADQRDGGRGGALGGVGAPPPGARHENPLLRSGLALAGANQRRAGAEDGILSALEAAGLDLWGTRLVVMSACETGLGEVRNGDGVHGLRRALLVAGAGAQVMSLWKVDDEATRDLMVGFYRRLAAGAGRGAALRAAQLDVLRRPGRAHPYFWAAFIQSGDWRRLGE